MKKKNLFSEAKLNIKILKDKYSYLYSYKSKKIEDKIILSNMKRLFPFLFLIIILEIIKILMLCFTKIGTLEIIYIVLCGLIILYCILNIIILNNLYMKEKNNCKQLKFYEYFTYYTFSIFGGIFSIFDLIIFGEISNFLLFCVIISTCLLFDIKSISKILLILLSTSILGFYFFGFPSYYLQTIIVGIIISLFLSQILFYIFKSYLIGEIDLIEQNKTLVHYAENDHLTSLLNRRGLNNRIKLLYPYIMKNNAEIGVFIIDIDKFKNFNDQYGHQEGDKCLEKIARSIKKSVKEKTDIVCRWGGEEFLVFLYEVNPEQCVEIAKRIKHSVYELKIKSAKEAPYKRVTVSIGISSGIMKKESDFDKLIEKADQKLYEAKATGRNKIFY